ncbi:hypothetical protein VTL71DRAFT_8637 [Oculimacula yallundae]|uniref:Glycosyltransferase family 28 N-terminal domain-containing protein n=1 Tax=Oculimacula yallundae TaxID=86028 RepID=A0ABR4CZP6_9HELO
MAPNSPENPSRISQPDALMQSMLEQAQAAASAESSQSTTTAAHHEALTQDTDLFSLASAETSVPPPAYGEVYGEIGDQKTGLGAHVTDDGRVNIRINGLNRRLSQVFAPALRQQVEGVEEDSPPPSPYIPPSLGGKRGAPPPPSLNVVIQVVGSRGDVQPFVALGKVLKATYGHRVRLATHPNFKGFVEENGLEFFSIGGDPSRLMAFMVKNPSLMPGIRSVLSGDVRERRKDVAEYIQGCWRSCYKAGDGMSLASQDDPLESTARLFVADCIIANPPSFAHIHLAEKLGIPLHIMFTMPYSPTQAFPHPLANIQSSNADAQISNYISYAMIEVLMWQGLGDIMNRFREKCLGLDPVSLIWAPGMLQRLKVPYTYCWSPSLIPKPKDWGSHISVSGFYFLDSASDYAPAPDLQAFLESGPPPVYVGFGSIVLEDPDGMTELIFEAARMTGQRILLSKGWGGMGKDQLRVPDEVFMLGNVPHDWLFKHVSCVVHHGGAGTTAAGITAGRPTLIVPFFGDQPFWGAMVARAGAGPDPIPHQLLTAERLAEGIEFCLRPESLESAKVLASKIAAERGCDTGAQSFHQYLEVERLRCTLAPTRAAAWRIKRTQVRLSPFAACTLANANLLDFHDLKLYRPREYTTDEGPWDPVSGFATAAFGAIISMAMGVAYSPSETAKAVMLPFGNSRRKAQTAVSATARGSQNSIVGTNSVQLSTSNSASSSRSDTLQGQPSNKQVSASNESGSDKEPDMMRRKGAHGSKGFGRIVKAALQSPMDVSVSITEGFHNAPKLYGDDTVRPQQRVTGIKSGAIAIGKEFSLGMYDGVTGLVTQPWRGAKKEGPVGFLKGFGKGVGGVLMKPGAAMFSLPAYLMKGVYKEVESLFGSNVQNYIIASRTAQGYEEWLQSSVSEKEDVLARWKLIQKYLKKNQNRDDMMQETLDEQRQANMETKAYSHSQTTSISSHTTGTVASNMERNSASVAMDSSQPRGGIMEAIIRQAVPDMPYGDEQENAAVERPFHENGVRIQQQVLDNENGLYTDEAWLDETSASEADASQHARDSVEYEEQLKRAVELSLSEQGQMISGGQRESSIPNDGSRGESGHVAGITRSEFEAQRQGQQGEKTAQEKTEEDIVMAYVAKQSILEMQHQRRGKDRACATDEQDDEDLRRALELSLQEQEHGYQYGYGAAFRSGEASGISRLRVASDR